MAFRGGRGDFCEHGSRFASVIAGFIFVVFGMVSFLDFGGFGLLCWVFFEELFRLFVRFSGHGALEKKKCVDRRSSKIIRRRLLSFFLFLKKLSTIL